MGDRIVSFLSIFVVAACLALQGSCQVTHYIDRGVVLRENLGELTTKWLDVDVPSPTSSSCNETRQILVLKVVGRIELPIVGEHARLLDGSELKFEGQLIDSDGVRYSLDRQGWYLRKDQTYILLYSNQVPPGAQIRSIRLQAASKVVCEKLSLVCVSDEEFSQ